jgi:hypothetical protein
MGYMLSRTHRVSGIISSQTGGRHDNTVDQIPWSLPVLQRGTYEF